MSVPANKRSESKIAFYTDAYKIHNDVVKYLINDFGIKKSSYDYQIFESRIKMNEDDKESFKELVDKYGIEIESDYCRFIVYHYRDAIIGILDDFVDNVTLAYSIYPNTEEEWHMKRKYQNAAIGDLNLVKTKIQIVANELPVNFNKLPGFIAQIDKEIKNLKQWRGDCNKERMKCIENDTVRRVKAEKGAADKLIAERERERKENIADKVIKLSMEPHGNDYVIPKYIMNQAYQNYMYGDYQFTYNPISGMIETCSNFIPCLINIDPDTGNYTGPMY